MTHRIIFWEVIPLVAVVIFGFLGDTFITSKWAWLICTIVLGLCSVEAGIENSVLEAKPETKKPPMVLNVLRWIIALPLVMFIIFTIMSVTSNIFIVLYVLMLMGSVLAITIICLYAKYIWECIKYFEPEEEVDENQWDKRCFLMKVGVHAPTSIILQNHYIFVIFILQRWQKYI